MAGILTPVSLWQNFDKSLETKAQVISESEADGIKIEKVTFLGRNTQKGRVKIAAAFASKKGASPTGTVLILPDSTDTIDEDLLKMFVNRGFSALMVDYRGQWEEAEFFTEYPEDVTYANTATCGRHKDCVDESADKTSWYEWAAVGIYARKYIAERTGSENIAVVGIRDGGEVAWKIATVESFSCIIPVCAAGWKAYAGISKYLSEEAKMDDERYRFIAGIDSQAYAPYVTCPVLMLCSTNDVRFDYDRAYDTFSRINPDYIAESTIAYSVRCNAGIGVYSVDDMFMFLDKHLKKRQVFIARPAVIKVEVDGEQNLVAHVNFDTQGVVEESRVYLAEDVMDSALRDWIPCPLKEKISASESRFYLNVYEKTSTIFVLCFVKYSNGFTVWSKMAVKKLNGKFRNMQSKCRLMYSNHDGIDSAFSVSDMKNSAVGGIFLDKQSKMPNLIKTVKDIMGLYSPFGLSTYRMNNVRFAPSEENVLSLDLYCEQTAVVTLSLINLKTGEAYYYAVNVVGGVWQNVIVPCKLFKTSIGTPLESYSAGMRFGITCPSEYAVNNVTWL